jgi:hypothetical protein
VGKPRSSLEEALSAFAIIKNDIPSDRFFELGENQKLLLEIESHFQQFHTLLSDLHQEFEARPLPENKIYFDALRVSQKIQNFLSDIHLKGRGEIKNTRIFKGDILELENILAILHVPSSTKENLVGKEIPSQERLSVAQSSTVPFKNKREPIDQESEQITRSMKERFKVFKARVNTYTVKPLGVLFFDIIGRQDPETSSSVIVGWIIITALLLLITLIILLSTGTFKIEEIIKFWQSVSPSK